MKFKPAHKQDNPAHAPGQVVNTFDRYPYMKHSTAEPQQPEQTLEDYISRKQRAAAFDAVAAEKKLTFEEWWKTFSQRYSLDDVDSLTADFKAAWKAAQENCR